MRHRLFYFSLATTFLISCGEKSPEEIVKEFHGSLLTGETDKIREQCTSEGKDQLELYSETFNYFGKNEKKEIASIKCSDGEEKITCWCEEVKGFVVQYELEKKDGKWLIDYRNFRPEVSVSLFHDLMNKGEYILAKDYATENGKQSLSLLQSMNESEKNGSDTEKELVSVKCEEENEKIICDCKDDDGKETRYPMVKENGEWKVDYTKTIPQSMVSEEPVDDESEVEILETVEETIEE